eukprot:gnl/TRDRNA2_/TRDRNA2_162703_c0_seq2.p1 gnl/TRDRNA2_/TRDRNA2_162703_c0~~gnl/TRDRNA2_/TRDRNA2_162703_c0_seq2.p1  ORF type:complete len:822 (+),score=85.95 gnl/TRDRNA2_/TRDRNA2_162703_c0_seq2:53-2518(+)
MATPTVLKLLASTFLVVVLASTRGSLRVSRVVQVADSAQETEQLSRDSEGSAPGEVFHADFALSHRLLKQYQAIVPRILEQQEALQAVQDDVRDLKLQEPRNRAHFYARQHSDSHSLSPSPSPSPPTDSGLVPLVLGPSPSPGPIRYTNFTRIAKEAKGKQLKSPEASISASLAVVAAVGMFLHTIHQFSHKAMGSSPGRSMIFYTVVIFFVGGALHNAFWKREACLMTFRAVGMEYVFAGMLAHFTVLTSFLHATAPEECSTAFMIHKVDQQANKVDSKVYMKPVSWLFTALRFFALVFRTRLYRFFWCFYVAFLVLAQCAAANGYVLLFSKLASEDDGLKQGFNHPFKVKDSVNAYLLMGLYLVLLQINVEISYSALKGRSLLKDIVNNHLHWLGNFPIVDFAFHERIFVGLDKLLYGMFSAKEITDLSNLSLADAPHDILDSYIEKIFGEDETVILSEGRESVQVTPWRTVAEKKSLQLFWYWCIQVPLDGTIRIDRHDFVPIMVLWLHVFQHPKTAPQAIRDKTKQLREEYSASTLTAEEKAKRLSHMHEKNRLPPQVRCLKDQLAISAHLERQTKPVGHFFKHSKAQFDDAKSDAAGAKKQVLDMAAQAQTATYHVSRIRSYISRSMPSYDWHKLQIHGTVVKSKFVKHIYTVHLLLHLVGSLVIFVYMRLTINRVDEFLNDFCDCGWSVWSWRPRYWEEHPSDICTRAALLIGIIEFFYGMMYGEFIYFLVYNWTVLDALLIACGKTDPDDLGKFRDFRHQWERYELFDKTHQTASFVEVAGQSVPLLCRADDPSDGVPPVHETPQAAGGESSSR